MKIGDTVFFRNRWQRGQAWDEYVIVGETRPSWLLDGGRDPIKLRKSDLTADRGASMGRDRAFTPQQKSEDDWVSANRRSIQAAVKDADYPTLLAVAAALGDKFVPAPAQRDDRE